MYLIFLQMPKMLKVLGRGSNKKPKFPRRCQRPPAMCNEPRNMQTVCAMCCSLESRVCRVRIEGRNDVVADQRFPQGPVSLPWGTTRQGSTRAWNCMVFYGIVWNCMVLCEIAFPQGPSFPSLGHKQARVSQGMGGKETFVVIADLCIVLYIERCVRTSCYQLCEYKPQIRIVHGPVSLLVVVSTMCCVTRARTGTLCTSESGFSWISCILDPSFLCIVPIHCSVSLGAAGSWERQIWMHSVPFFRRGVCGQNLGFFRGRPSLSSPTCPLALFYQHIRGW